MKDREKRTSFQKAPQDTQVWVCRLMVIPGCVTICSPLFKKQKIQEVLSKCFYCFPTLTLKHSLCMQANTVRFLHFLDEKSDFSFPPIRAAIYIILVKKKNKKKKKLEIESYHCVFPEDPCSPITFQNFPSKHFSHYCLHISHPFALFSSLERPDFWFLEFFTSLSQQLQGRLLHTWFQIQPTKKHLWRKKCVWCRWLNRKFPTHFTLHCILSSHSLFWRGHTSYYSHLFSSFTH